MIISNHYIAFAHTRLEHGRYSVIFITDEDLLHHGDLWLSINRNAANLIGFTFEDVEFGINAPTRNDVQLAIEWGRKVKSEDLIVCCMAGISRSSAIAYCIECTRTDPEQALNILDKKFHYPNSLIVNYGAKILGKLNMIENIENWKSLGGGK